MPRLLRTLFAVVMTLVALLVMILVTGRYWLPERFAVNLPFRALIGKANPLSPEAVATELRVPAGFAMTRFATGLANARFLRVTEAGDVIVSQPREGRVTLLGRDENRDGVSDGSASLLSELDRPHGLALRDGYLYVAEMTAVGRIRFDPATRETTGRFDRVITGLPGGGNHWTRTIGFGPDGFLYVSVGSSCNVCVEEDSRRAAISRYDPATWRGTVFASGLRNSVGFAWRTVADGQEPAHELIATDNGRDLLGDAFPPCELNRVVEGGFYGWPFANGDRVMDPDQGAGREKEIAASIAPVHNFPAHNAPLGIAFLDARETPAGYRGAALVALHGSWNRTAKDGYKVVSLHWDEMGRITERDFLTGFLKGETVLGRPVDIAQGSDGAIFVSDDYTGSIFQLRPGAQPSPPAGTAAAAAAPVADRLAQSLDPGAVARGERLWEENRCEQCHDPKLAGAAPNETIKQLERLSVRYDVPRLVTYLKVPQPPMPVFEMSDPERADLAAYLLNRFP